jgi:hypothetical protein
MADQFSREDPAMKAVTEFANVTLTKAISAHAALLADGKTPEDIEASLGTAFKLEGDRLKHFLVAIDVASKNTENLKRVIVVSLAEGESAPQKAQLVELTAYVPEFYGVMNTSSQPKSDEKGGRGGKGGKGGDRGPKSSPWGLSPEEKAAKNAKKAPAKA